MTTDFYDEYLPYQKRLDLLGMAQHGVLRLPIACSSTVQLIAYNQKRGLPKTRAERKEIVEDIRAQEIAALVPAW